MAKTDHCVVLGVKKKKETPFSAGVAIQLMSPHTTGSSKPTAAPSSKVRAFSAIFRPHLSDLLVSCSKCIRRVAAKTRWWANEDALFAARSEVMLRECVTRSKIVFMSSSKRLAVSFVAVVRLYVAEKFLCKVWCSSIEMSFSLMAERCRLRDLARRMCPTWEEDSEPGET